MQIALHRPKRPRDAYKATNDAHSSYPDPARAINLKAVEHGRDERGRYFVRFAHVHGFKRTRIKKMPPFWDTDLARALLDWNRENGGEPVGTGCYGSRFITDVEGDATMMRLAFA